LFKSLVDQVLADEEACRILDFGVRDDALRDNNNDWGRAEYTLASMLFILILYSSMSARWDDMALMARRHSLKIATYPEPSQMSGPSEFK